jgi:transcriptional regulator with XRE-family HTH domain
MASMKTQKIKDTKSSQVLGKYMDITGSSVAEVAKRTGLTRSFIYMVLRGQHEVGITSMFKFRDGLGIGLDKWR